MKEKTIRENKVLKGRLYNDVISDTNIYNAIYCLESYIFEKGLLHTEDLELYVKLCDKYNFDYISKVIIPTCQKKLHLILSNPEELFEIQVYFKLKKWDINEKKIKYRPIHTASLLDQICMVCLLMPLMFNDKDGKREKSELTKLIPHNFYGNIPSTNVERLFEPWQQKYKEYTDNVVAHCKQYQKSHRYRTEVSLDITNFFPSIWPEYIYKFIIDKLKSTYKDQKDKDTLHWIVTKLLYFKINPKNLDGWMTEYYGKETTFSKTSFLMNCGIPQGLPQSYFFGNLCMIDIQKKLKENNVFKKGDAYFYVDDSVIYIERDITSEDFASTIGSINEAVGKMGNVDATTGEIKPSNISSNYISQSYIKFQSKLSYIIKFHEEGKSDYCPIEDANINIGGYDLIAKEISMAGSVYNNLDEIEDNFSREKLKVVCKAVEREITKLKKQGKHNPPNEGKNSKYASRLKLLQRYKRFFLYRLKLLEIRKDGEITDDDIEKFKKQYFISKQEKDTTLNLIFEEWFSRFDEEIFQSEARLMLSTLSIEKSKKMLNDLITFEKDFSKVTDNTAKWLFFTQDFKSTITLKYLNYTPYYSLIKWIHSNYKGTFKLSQTNQIEQFKNFVTKLKDSDRNLDADWISVRPKCSNFIFASSSEFSRKILNAYFSETIGIATSNAYSFTKQSNRQLHYIELRILAQLRNNQFNLPQFIIFINSLDPKNLENRMSIDMGLLEVLGFFITKVRNPEWIDNLILTHRVVKGLWYNGSKFMNSYTLHNEEHAVTLINKIVRLVKAIDYLTIKRADYYIIFLACYLHDISMVIHPNIENFCNGDEQSLSIVTEFIHDIHTEFDKYKAINPMDDKDINIKKTSNYLIKKFEAIFTYFENDIRNRHARESAQYIREWHNGILKYLSPIVLTEVAKISESHGMDVAEIYGLKSDAKNSLISEKYMMMLIRLADSLDVANDRINYYLLRQNVQHMSQDSQFHWISHLITDAIHISPTFEIHQDENKNLFEHPITERLNFNLCINVKYISEINHKDCKFCRLNNSFDTNIVNIPDEYDKAEGMTIDIFKEKEGVEDNKKCPILCRWVMNKHRWLIEELIELQHYLNSVNSNLFKTEIRLNIIYRDDYHLDADLFDSVKEYLEKE